MLNLKGSQKVKDLMVYQEMAHVLLSPNIDAICVAIQISARAQVYEVYLKVLAS